MKNFKKIFQIGFNKCGTTSIHQFLLNNGIRSVHWEGGKIADEIIKTDQPKIHLEYIQISKLSRTLKILIRIIILI